MKTSVIVLSWNGMEYLEDCLDAVLTQDHPDFEVIVVDNGSTDGSADFVAEHYPQVRLIRNERNLGFAAGNNVGLRAATGDVLVLLNQDTVVQAGWLAALTDTLQSDPEIGIAGSKALYPNGSIQHAGGYVSIRGEGIHHGYRREANGQFDRMREVDFVTAAALAITRQAFEAIGELDEGFTPAYYEDVDWCYRAREAGCRVVYVPQAVLIHKEASTVADLSHEGMYLSHRNRMRFVLKHWPLDQFVGEFLPAEKSWLEDLGEGGERLVASVHHAYLYHLLHLSDLMAWRLRTLGTALDETETLADALLTLRTVVPLGPARIGLSSATALDQHDELPLPEPVKPPSEPAPERAAEPSIKEEVLEELHQRWAIQEHQFRSDVPILGPLIAAFRRRWNSVSTRWYVQPIIRQQSEFNARVVRMLGHFTQDMRRAVNRLDRQKGRLNQQEGWLNRQGERLSQQENQLNQEEYDRQRLGEVLTEYIAEGNREIGELARQIQELKTLTAKLAAQCNLRE
jgi:GT2 family glycosyltransferase